MIGRAAVRTGTLAGVQVLPVDVEVDVGRGLPSFSIVGLPDAAVQEARERVRSALRASGFDVPNARVVVNLAPAPLRKHGTGFDLPIAIGVLAATGQIPASYFDGAVAVGELSLDGSLRSVPGLLAFGLAARKGGRSLVAPSGCVSMQGLDGLDLRPLRSLEELRAGLPASCSEASSSSDLEPEGVDFADVLGQEMAIRALVAAAVGGHNVLMVGPPGSGKTMLARRLPSILPPLDPDERLESALIHSVAGHDETRLLAGVRPFRAPHHSASIAGLVGGGSPPRPGEASLAHNGVLFLDEMPEFGPGALQCLRQPMEDGVITLVRAEGRLTFPARFSLIGSANPCPCGFLGDVTGRCSCPPGVIDRYRSRIGGPLMDRIDLVCDVWRPDPGLLVNGTRGTTSRELSDRVRSARVFAHRRSMGQTSNLSGAELLAACAMPSVVAEELESIARLHHLSGRGVTRMLRVSRTFADLENSERVHVEHLHDALLYRASPGR